MISISNLSLLIFPSSRSLIPSSSPPFFDSFLTISNGKTPFLLLFSLVIFVEHLWPQIQSDQGWRVEGGAQEVFFPLTISLDYHILCSGPKSRVSIHHEQRWSQRGDERGWLRACRRGRKDEEVGRAETRQWRTDREGTWQGWRLEMQVFLPFSHCCRILCSSLLVSLFFIMAAAPRPSWRSWEMEKWGRGDGRWQGWRSERWHSGGSLVGFLLFFLTGF